METSARRPERAKRDPLAERLKARVPAWYRPGLQWLASMLALAAYGALIAWMGPEGRSRPLAWLGLPFGFMFASGAEYVMHRFPMHKRRRTLERFFRRHTLLHHRYFDHTHLEMSSRRDGYFVLSTGRTAVLTALLLTGVYFIMRGVIGPHFATIATVTMVIYSMVVESMHIAYHLPESMQRRWPLRWRAFQYLRELHRDHHDPKVMTRFNFAIGLPQWDLICGTYRPPRAAEDELPAAASHSAMR